MDYISQQMGAKVNSRDKTLDVLGGKIFTNHSCSKVLLPIFDFTWHILNISFVWINKKDLWTTEMIYLSGAVEWKGKNVKQKQNLSPNQDMLKNTLKYLWYIYFMLGQHLGRTYEWANSASLKHQASTLFHHFDFLPIHFPLYCTGGTQGPGNTSTNI